MQCVLTCPEKYKLAIDSGGWVSLKDVANCLYMVSDQDPVVLILKTIAWINSLYPFFIQVAGAYDSNGFIKEILALRFTRNHTKEWIDPLRLYKKATAKELKELKEAWVILPFSQFRIVLGIGVTPESNYANWHNLDFVRFWGFNLNTAVPEARRLAGNGDILVKFNVEQLKLHFRSEIYMEPSGAFVVRGTISCELVVLVLSHTGQVMFTKSNPTFIKTQQFNFVQNAGGIAPKIVTGPNEDLESIRKELKAAAVGKGKTGNLGKPSPEQVRKLAQATTHGVSPGTGSQFSTAITPPPLPLL